MAIWKKASSILFSNVVQAFNFRSHQPGFKSTDKNSGNQLNIGEWAEQQAEQYLQQKGLKTKQKNYRCKVGEIDIVMTDRDSLVFVEVRSRKHKDYGSAFESVNRHKQQKLVRAAKHYLQANKLTDKIPCRFDVVSVSSLALDTKQNNGSQIEWITNAFSTS